VCLRFVLLFSWLVGFGGGGVQGQGQRQEGYLASRRLAGIGKTCQPS